MTKEQIACIRQISETADLLSRQLSNLADLFQIEESQTEGKSEVRREVLEVQNASSGSAIDTEEKKHYPIMYFGAPSGSGFEEGSQLQPSSVKCLYIIQQTSEIKALYYPIPEKLSRFKMNPNPLFNVVCDSVGDISEASSIEFTEDDYGELEFENGYWKVNKKCTVFCNK